VAYPGRFRILLALVIVPLPCIAQRLDLAIDGTNAIVGVPSQIDRKYLLQLSRDIATWTNCPLTGVGTGDRLVFAPSVTGNVCFFRTVATPINTCTQAAQLRVFAQMSYSNILSIVDPAATATSVTRFTESHIEVNSPEWTYRFASSGRRVFRALDNLPWVTNTFTNNLGPNVATWESSGPDTNLVGTTTNLALQAFGIVYSTNVEVVAQRELLVTALVAGGETNHYQGRTVVRLNEPGFVEYTLAIYAPGGRPVRLECTMPTLQIQNMRTVFRQALAQGLITEIQPDEGDLVFSTFYDPGEYRFKVTSLSYQGEKFLQLADETNPFPTDNFDITYPDLVDANAYTNSSDYKKWCWYWWDFYGRANGVRGNWDTNLLEWDKPNITVGGHNCLTNYTLVGGEPTNFTEHVFTDGSTGVVPFVTGAKLEPEFYSDLEASHAALITTHGGPINDVYQFRRGFDVWVTLHVPGDDGLGVGNLRHLFLEGCASINYLTTNSFRNLFTRPQ